MRKVHRLKTWPEYFQAIKELRKKMEWREDDRGFQVEDFLVLDEYDLENGYSDRMALVSVSHIVPGGYFQIPETHVAMSIDAHFFTSKEEEIKQRLNTWKLSLPERNI